MHERKFQKKYKQKETIFIKVLFFLPCGLKVSLSGRYLFRNIKDAGACRRNLRHGFSSGEPSLNREELEALGRQSPFTVEGTKFVETLCCLVLKKDTDFG